MCSKANSAPKERGTIQTHMCSFTVSQLQAVVRVTLQMQEGAW